MSHVILAVLCFGLLYGLSYLLLLIKTPDKDREETKKKTVAGLQNFLVLMAVLTILYPVWYWAKDELLPTATCQAASQYGKSSCLINQKWSAPLMQADEPGLATKRLCVTPAEVKSQRFVNNAGAYWRFKAVNDDEVLMTYKFMDACPKGEIP